MVGAVSTVCLGLSYPVVLLIGGDGASFGKPWLIVVLLVSVLAVGFSAG